MRRVAATAPQAWHPSASEGRSAASALQCGATLLHKDPEFQPITGLDQEWLGQGKASLSRP